LEEVVNLQSTTHWTTREGETLRIVDMSDDHLENTLLCLKQRAEYFFSRYVKVCLYSGCESALKAQANPWKWLKRTPVVQALRDESKRREEIRVERAARRLVGKPIYLPCRNQQLPSRCQVTCRETSDGE
jgi:hypothetical protein